MSSSPRIEPLPLDHRAIQTHGIALLDPLQVERDQWEDLPNEGIVPAKYAQQSQLFPRLIDLSVLDIGTRVGLLSRMEGWWRQRQSSIFCALLASSSAPLSILQYLSRRLKIRSPAGDVDILRFYDSRVMRHLVWILDVEQMATLLGPITRWSWCEPGGNWFSYVNDSSVSTTTWKALQLGEQQWDKLGRLAEINQGLTVLARTQPELPNDVAMAMRLDALLEEAWSRYRLADREDRWLYAEQAFRFGKNVHQHLEIQQRLRLVGNDTTTYVGACADLDDDAMRHIATESAQLRLIA